MQPEEPSKPVEINKENDCEKKKKMKMLAKKSHLKGTLRDISWHSR